MSDGVLLGQLVVIWWKRWWRKDDDDCITVVARRYGNLISNSHRDSFRFLLRSFLFFAEFLLKFSFYFLHCQFHFFFPFFLFLLSFLYGILQNHFTAKEEEDRETSSSSSSLWRERRKIEVLKRVATVTPVLRCVTATSCVGLDLCTTQISSRAPTKARRRPKAQHKTTNHLLLLSFLSMCVCGCNELFLFFILFLFFKLLCSY